MRGHGGARPCSTPLRRAPPVVTPSLLRSLRRNHGYSGSVTQRRPTLRPLTLFWLHQIENSIAKRNKVLKTEGWSC